VKSVPPQSLIQIHYHDRFGGVNKVIGLYARAFESIAGKGRRANFVICNKGKTPGVSFYPARTMHVPFCGYHAFTAKAECAAVAKILIEAIEKALSPVALPRPAWVVGHNLTLGKNSALSSAFAQCARKHDALKDGVYFFSIIHDLAEEGRVDCIAQMDALRKKGLHVWEDCYPCLDTFRYLSPNSRTVVLLQKTGLSARLLVNPVEVSETDRLPASLKQTNKTRNTLARIASKQGIDWNKNAPILLYPCRCVSRKNVIEAMLLSRYVLKNNLLLGAAGASPRDRVFYKEIKMFCLHRRMPVLFDSGRMISAQKALRGFPAEICGAAHACITTSIAEGFGYALYEPWLYNKAVFGRKPLGFEPHGKVAFQKLYDRLPIPAAWISVPALCDKYFIAMRQCFGALNGEAIVASRRRFGRAFIDYFIISGTIDFGCLDVRAQLAVCEALRQSPKKMDEWEKLCGKELNAIRGVFENSVNNSDALIMSNRKRIEKGLSMERFSRAFGRSFSDKSTARHAEGVHIKILREFRSFSKFRLLMTPEE
jgi:hypothetical protein